MEMKYIAYYRVSTKKQGRSGLSLEAQRETVLTYIRHNGNQVIGEFTEVESGKNDKRPELLKAIRMTKENDGTLVIAKLDRLSRNMTFISQLMDSKVKFVCCDMPEASELTVHIFAAIAQWERKRISERIKDALDAKRLREPDWKPGTPNLTDEGRQKSYSTIRSKAREDSDIRKAYHYIKLLRQDGMSFERIATRLNSEGYSTPRRGKFYATSVKNIWDRFELQQESRL
jgi:DNA invertase Pin-like site-specific DNA recombinase